MTRSDNNRLRTRHATPPIIAKWCIWTVANQNWLAGQIRLYVWGGTATLAVFTFSGHISPQAALISMFISGTIIAAAIWLLIRQRRIWLLNIRQPELRQEALAAMVRYLVAIDHPLPRQMHKRPVQENDPEKETDYGRIR
jgi:hypothetical protein